MEKGRGGMGHSKHRKCEVHGNPVSQRTKQALERQDNTRESFDHDNGMHKTVRDAIEREKEG